MCTVLQFPDRKLFMMNCSSIIPLLFVLACNSFYISVSFPVYEKEVLRDCTTAQVNKYHLTYGSPATVEDNLVHKPLSELKAEHLQNPKMRIRKKRYALLGMKWTSKDISYKISQYPKHLSKLLVDKEIQKAFNMWSKYTDLKFTMKKGVTDIDIRFGSRKHYGIDVLHGLFYPFDGPGGTLAHSYVVDDEVHIHFDDEEPWRVGTKSGVNLLQIATHEIGHALGLDHSKVPGAVMYTYYKKYQPPFHLHNDDIKAIQTLYGKKGSGDSDITVENISDDESDEYPFKDMLKTFFGSYEYDDDTSNSDGDDREHMEFGLTNLAGSDHYYVMGNGDLFLGDEDSFDISLASTLSDERNFDSQKFVILLDF